MGILRRPGSQSQRSCSYSHSKVFKKPFCATFLTVILFPDPEHINFGTSAISVYRKESPQTSLKLFTCFYHPIFRPDSSLFQLLFLNTAKVLHITFQYNRFSRQTQHFSQNPPFVTKRNCSGPTISKKLHLVRKPARRVILSKVRLLKPTIPILYST